MKAKYAKWHNNYDLTLGKVYDAYDYSEEWLLVPRDDMGNRVLYRKDCFERVTN